MIHLIQCYHIRYLNIRIATAAGAHLHWWSRRGDDILRELLSLGKGKYHPRFIYLGLWKLFYYKLNQTCREKSLKMRKNHSFFIGHPPINIDECYPLQSHNQNFIDEFSVHDLRTANDRFLAAIAALYVQIDVMFSLLVLLFLSLSSPFCYAICSKVSTKSRFR